MAVISADTLVRARELAQDLRQEGRDNDAKTIDTLLQVVSQTQETPRYLTTTEIGRRLGVSRQTVVNWIKQGVLTGVRLGGRWMIPATVLARFEQLERVLDQLDSEREPGKPDEVIELVGRGRENWTWQGKAE
jgi:excisionase family DNA binding protein